MEAAGTLPLLLILLLAALPAPSHAWGVDGHLMGRLSGAAAAAVKDLLPSYAGNNLSSLCSWADDVKFRYPRSPPLHYIDTPDGLCTYSYDRDCKDEDGVKGRCVAGAINNYTSQLLTYRRSSSPEYNLTQALLFLSHFIGDIHQPLHVGFTSDKGGNTIDVHWYTRKTVLHHVWDSSIIQTAEDDFYGDSVAGYIDTLKKNITQGEWSEQVSSWEACGKNQTACPDISLFLQQTADRQLEASTRRRQISRHFEQDFWLMMESIHYETIMELNDIHITIGFSSKLVTQ
ncbi:unnamed protein product [Miscanthus lutarioriparius]|uniref:Aspergillus nuclease S1 n=1 Tax=Miscanthus lutarioriparius TaxID=422564 RepID=A0A811NYF6_9POAL|nr:unnamed protein product [Miscanthus lutarioriparius]